MTDKSHIDWTDATWNPVTGCTKVSAGCKNCYAEREWPRLAANPKAAKYYGREFTDVRCHEEVLDQPLRWQKPRRIFVNSMSDLFHENVPDYFIGAVFNTMYDAKRHQFQLLTKRPDRMCNFMLGTTGCGANYDPIPNIWYGVSVEDQKAADERIPSLLLIPAVVHWVSMEPLLGPVHLTHVDYGAPAPYHLDALVGYCENGTDTNLDWVVVGGESGPKARPMHPDWVRALRDQCITAGVPFFFKQWGEWLPISPVYSNDIDPQEFIDEWDDGKRELLAMDFSGFIWNHWKGDKDIEFNGQPATSSWYFAKVGKQRAGRELDGQIWDQYPEV
ncbi:MAG: phage Gp37/Gp68 family protein [Pseudomonadota bacterium]|nr:phage Gp37/Gp68 family protein [Pseudomonadota bacterium]